MTQQFDPATLTPGQLAALRIITARLISLNTGRRTAAEAVEAGLLLLKVKEFLPAGQYGPWQALLHWTPRRSRHFTQIAQFFTIAEVDGLPINEHALLILARAGSAEAKARALALAGEGVAVDGPAAMALIQGKEVERPKKDFKTSNSEVILLPGIE